MVCGENMFNTSKYKNQIDTVIKKLISAKQRSMVFTIDTDLSNEEYHAIRQHDPANIKTIVSDYIYNIPLDKVDILVEDVCLIANPISGDTALKIYCHASLKPHVYAALIEIKPDTLDNNNLW